MPYDGWSEEYQDAFEALTQDNATALHDPSLEEIFDEFLVARGQVWHDVEEELSEYLWENYNLDLWANSDFWEAWKVAYDAGRG